MGKQKEDKAGKSNKNRNTAKPDDISIDFEQRDPYDLNEHVRVRFPLIVLVFNIPSPNSFKIKWDSQNANSLSLNNKK